MFLPISNTAIWEFPVFLRKLAGGTVRLSGDIRGPMPSWVLHCIHCKSEFTHSLIDDMKMLSYMFPAKPEFPPAGAELECPNCGLKATYQRTDLTYRA